MTGTNETSRPCERDDIAVWPDGTYVDLDDLWRGGWDFMGDDYKVVRHDDYARMRVLGLDELADEYDPG